MKASNLHFKVVEKKLAIQEPSPTHLWIQAKSVFYTLVQIAAIFIILPLLLGYFHIGYKRAAMASALQGNPYRDRDTAQAYLQNLAQQNISPGTNQEQFVDALIKWINNNMKLQGRMVNHPNPVYLIEHGGICGQFATATTKILRANGYEARQVLLNWNGKGTAHVIIEVKINGQWTAFDPLGFGGGAYPQETFVSHITDGQNKLNALELYHRTDLLPPNNTYNWNFFKQGEAIKVETISNYSNFSVQPDYLYGRDWPTIRTTADENSTWVYQEHSTNRLQDIETWSELPYFSRMTLWFGTTPVVLHFEYPILFLAMVAVWFIRYRKMLNRIWRIRGALYLSFAMVLYTVGIMVIWINRYSL